jgi:NAD(P)-dependent dehydrogenase (short-subunit alcohol dehydrogenase family)
VTNVDPRGNQPLRDAVALVTGVPGGLGDAIARTLARAGALVTFIHRSDPDRSQAVAAIRDELASLSPAGRSYAVKADLRSATEAHNAVAEIVEACGPVSILVNNAGTNVPEPAIDVTEATWELLLDSNLKSAFFVSQAVARPIIVSGATPHGVSIVSVASQMGLVGYPGRSVYCASKAGLINLTRALAVEWASHGIRVNAVAPTFINTPLAAEFLADPAFRNDAISRIPLGRIGEPQDVANGVLYLSSPAASLVTGHTLVIDGGWTAW